MPNYFDNDGCGYEHPGDALAQRDPAEYPADWTPQQRLTAYWYAHGYQITVDSTDSWRGVLIAAERISDRRHNKISPLRTGRPNLQLITQPADEDVPF